jgi:hypothetical protein
MKIPDEIRKTVGFVAYHNKATEQITPVGSCFFLGHDPKDGQKTSKKMYAVTARHVIDQLRDKGVEQTILRLNPTLPSDTNFIGLIAPINDWYVHPTDRSIDVAIFEMGVPKGADHLVIPISMCATKDVFKRHEIDLGDEVIISGLFQHHFGTRRNIPIIRVGNLAALNEEKIATNSFGEIDAYLIEVRSIGGLSGSPAFLNLGTVRFIEGQVKHANKPIFLLLGLVHGHYDVSGNDESSSSAINAGIAIVVPVESILATVNEYEKSH